MSNDTVSESRQRILDLRRRYLEGEQLTKAEISEALKLLRESGRNVATKQKREKSKSSTVPQNLSDLFS